VAARREGEGAVPKDRASGRSRLLPEGGWVAQVRRVLAGGSAAPFQPRHPVDRVLGVPLLARLVAPLGARDRAPVVSGEPPVRPRVPGPLAGAEPRRRRPRVLQSPRGLESRAEKRVQVRARQSPAAGKRRERRPAPRRAPRSPAAVRRKSHPREGLSLAVGAARAPVRGAAPGGRFFSPRAQCPRRGYSQVTALFPE